MATLNLSNFDFSKEELRQVSELLFDDILHSPEISALHTIYDKVVTGKDIGWVGEGGLVGKQAQGCDPTPQAWSVVTRVKTWDPKRWEVFLEECATEIHGNSNQSARRSNPQNVMEIHLVRGQICRQCIKRRNYNKRCRPNIL